MKPSESVELLAVLQAAFPRDAPTDLTLSLYAERLARFDATAAREGVDLLIDHREETWFPAWATIRQSVNNVARRPQRFDPQPSAADLEATQTRIGNLIRTVAKRKELARAIISDDPTAVAARAAARRRVGLDGNE